MASKENRNQQPAAGRRETVHDVASQREQELKPDQTVTGAGETSVNRDHPHDPDLSFESTEDFGTDGKDNALEESIELDR